MTVPSSGGSSTGWFRTISFSCAIFFLTLEVPEPEEGRVGRARVASYTVRLVRHSVPE